MLDNLDMGNFAPSSRRYPFIHFKPDREVGNDVLSVNGLTKNIGGRNVLNNVSFVVCGGDKIAFVGEDELARTTLFQILMGSSNSFTIKTKPLRQIKHTRLNDFPGVSC